MYDKIIMSIGFLFFLASAFVATPWLVSADEKRGEALFKQHCAVCHPDGGNVINPKKTLHKKDMSANKIKTAKDIIRIMRNPGPGMLKFDEATIPNDEARKIAEYVLKTYNK